jgi:hypothetical protein
MKKERKRTRDFLPSYDAEAWHKKKQEKNDYGLLRGSEHPLLYKEECLFVLYVFAPCRSQCNQTLHGIFFRLGEGQGLLFDPKFELRGYLVILLLERYSK